MSFFPITNEAKLSPEEALESPAGPSKARGPRHLPAIENSKFHFPVYQVVLVGYGLFGAGTARVCVLDRRLLPDLHKTRMQHRHLHLRAYSNRSQHRHDPGWVSGKCILS